MNSVITMEYIIIKNSRVVKIYILIKKINYFIFIKYDTYMITHI